MCIRARCLRRVYPEDYMGLRCLAELSFSGEWPFSGSQAYIGRPSYRLCTAIHSGDFEGMCQRPILVGPSDEAHPVTSSHLRRRSFSSRPEFWSTCWAVHRRPGGKLRCFNVMSRRFWSSKPLTSRVWTGLLCPAGMRL